jgi:hypothetical protein
VTNINGVDPMGSMVRVTDEVDEEAEHRQAVAYELKPLRAQAEARRRFDAEKAGPAMPFDWGTESGITEGLFTVQLRGRRNPLGISSSATTTAGSSGSRPSARTVTRSSSFHTVPL